MSGLCVRAAGAEGSSDSNIQQVRGGQKMKSQAATCPVSLATMDRDWRGGASEWRTADAFASRHREARTSHSWFGPPHLPNTQPVGSIA